MNQIMAKKVIENGEEVIVLDLNQPWPKKSSISEYETETRKRTPSKEFITIIN